MEELFVIVSSAFETGQSVIDANDQRLSNVEKKLHSYLIRARETLAKPAKPAKRPMRTIQDEDEEDEINAAALVPERVSSTLRQSNSDSIRPSRTAKAKANQNLKEPTLAHKLRNENNIAVMIKTERVSTASSRESVKENREPENGSKRKSPDEGIQSATESEAESAPKRSNSVEYITAKTVEIDITSGDDYDRMPPPAIPIKIAKKARTKQKKEEPEVVPTGLRVTRSKIKQEKVSIPLNPPVMTESETTVTSEIDVTANKKTKKKYPMPILVKIEKPEVAKKMSGPKVDSPVVAGDATFNIPSPDLETVTGMPMNETVTIQTGNQNATMTIEKNPHDSLMTEDNDDEEVSEEIPLAMLKPQKQEMPPLPSLKLKKNEVFNPYLCSPVKQKVQAFEKHAQVVPTPEKYKPSTSKYSTLKSGTPSKIALFSKVTTPLSSSKSQKPLYSSSTMPMPSSAPCGSKTSKSLKKVNSMSAESLEESKKPSSSAALNALEEKRRIREEKMRQAQQQREALEKEKREQAMKLQIEREEKYRKLMKEKEEKLRMDALKKKIAKEKQAKKFAEEKAKKDDIVTPKPVESMNESLHLKLQKQIMADKTHMLRKQESKNVYGFEMLHTDDETDDESRPTNKRPEAPRWSHKSLRKPAIVVQSYNNESVLDNLFSVQPIQVDLRDIFPNIDVRKLVRNSSAIWRTPPKHYPNHF